MSPSELSQRFQKNPWPWLILLLTISLGLTWVRENHVLQKEIIGEYPRNVAGATPALHMMFLAPPKFVDPFGNVYSFHASHYDWRPALKPASYHFRLVVTSRNLDRTAGRMFAYLRFNDKQIANNVRVGYNEAESQPLPEGLPRVIVIGSGSTASASELFINGLRPFVDVVLIGETTYGKPYGFVPRSDCGTIYNAVQFEILNADGVGGYTDGLAPACQVADDLDRQLGDPVERRTRVALDYVVTGRCSAQAPQSFVMRRAPAQVSGETTAPGMFAD